jgi:hypothetical protein
MRFTSLSRITIALALVASSARPALAGPPLVCFPFDIGPAHSLPWDSKPNTWKGQRADYQVASLTRDTLALLTPSTPVIVRMETLRRAAIYASTDQDVARGLLMALLDRTKAKGAEPLAVFDAGYLAETYKQLGPISKATGALAGGIDGYAMVSDAASKLGADPAVAFAAAMITADGRRAGYADHVRLARAGAPADQLLAKNIGHLEH